MADTEKAADSARALVRSVDAGILSTHSKELAGYPFGSITPYVLMPGGGAVIYISNIAQHTHNIALDPKVCLTVVEAADDSQASGRVSLVGDAVPVPTEQEADVGERYFTFFESSRKHAQTHDFRFFEIMPVRVRFIAGFGSIHWIEKEAWVQDEPEWHGNEASIIDHMNDDHADSLSAMCRSFVADESDEARMLSLDPNGFHVRTANHTHYMTFEAPCTTTQAVREEMIRLSRLASA
jgi:putative heme iron utilization protein